MNKLMSSLKKKAGSTDDHVTPEGDTPVANVARSIKLFCESGGPNNASSQGEEVVNLPVIVDSAESSPEAAKEAAYTIRKFLSKDNNKRPYVQYNAIMLIRILADNPGKTFTRNLDGKFITTTKELLRTTHDPSVNQMMCEALTDLSKRTDDTGLDPLKEFWAKEQEKRLKNWPAVSVLPYKGNARAGTADQQQHQQQDQQNYFARNHKTRGLPSQEELAARIEEARTSAKLLQQVVRSTPNEEVPDNELIKEFAERCQSASRSIQVYIHAENPAPDHDTLLTLIETNEQLSNAMSKHQRALLNARKAAAPDNGAGNPVEMPTKQEPENPFADDNQPPSNLQAPLQPEQSSTKPHNPAVPQLSTAPLPVQNHAQDPYSPGFGSEKAPSSATNMENSVDPSHPAHSADEPVYYQRPDHETARGGIAHEDGQGSSRGQIDTHESVAYRY